MNRILIDPAVSVKKLDNLFGLFFEDLNHAADGGLYAELVRNRSFEFCPLDNKAYTPLTAWETVGAPKLAVGEDAPLNPQNTHYLCLEGQAGEGVRNLGFGEGMAVSAGEKCRFSLFAASDRETRLHIAIVSPMEGVIAGGDLTVNGGWRKYGLPLACGAACADGYLEITLPEGGAVRLDMVSLFPEHTFRERENGLRVDIAQALCDMKPQFLRFPGGCLIHDGQLDSDARDGMYRWKNTVGPVEERPARRSNWGYNQTFGLGFYELFCFCEDIGARPVPVVSGGCDPHHKRFAVGEQLKEFIQDALDLIEFANGAPDTRWGGLRARMGHPAPFGLEYLCIGNEEVHQAFFDRLPLFVKAVRDKYPDIRLIGTAGPFAAGSEFERGWRSARQTGVELVDEHYYQSPEWYLSNLDRYEGYPAQGPRVFLGEYASWGNQYENALAEAAYMAHMQNAPALAMACYAPMLARIGYVNWKPDMIYYNNRQLVKTANYHVQSLFMRYQGTDAVKTETQGLAAEKISEAPPIAGDLLIRADESELALAHITLICAGERRELADAAIGGQDKLLLAKGLTGEFTLTLTARRTGGKKGMQVHFGWQNDQNYYQWGFGGWENQDCILEKRENNRGSCLTQTAFSIEDGQTYELKLTVEGRRVRTWIDGVPMNDVTDRLPAPDKLSTAVSRDAQGAVIIKAVNVNDFSVKSDIDIAGWENEKARLTVEELSGLELSAENVLGEKEAVAPQTSDYVKQGQFQWEFPPRSITVMRVEREG